MALVDRTISIVGGLVPGPDAHPDKHYFWRLRVGLVLCVTFVGLVGVTGLAFGMIPGVFTGFASADDLRSVVAEVREGRAESLQQQLLDLRTKHCKATTSEARQLYWQMMSDASSKYQHLTKQTWQMPPCDAL